MGFERLDNPVPPKSKGRDTNLGARLQLRSLTRMGRKSEWIKLTIGQLAAAKLSMTLPRHRVHLLFGTGDDLGKLAVSVDNSEGAFAATRAKKGHYSVTIPLPAMQAKVKMPFETIYCELMEIHKINPAKPVFGVIDIRDALP